MQTGSSKNSVLLRGAFALVSGFPPRAGWHPIPARWLARSRRKLSVTALAPSCTNSFMLGERLPGNKAFVLGVSTGGEPEPLRAAHVPEPTPRSAAAYPALARVPAPQALRAASPWTESCRLPWAASRGTATDHAPAQSFTQPKPDLPRLLLILEVAVSDTVHAYLT